MKLVVLSGFLGSGKTSVLMPLAHEIVDSCEGGDKGKLVIIENEIGQVGVDNVFTEGGGYTSKELFNGCVCCSILGDLMDCLVDIEKNEDPSWVILETTGLARPADLADGLWAYYDDDMNITTCVVIDASRWMMLVEAEGLNELVFDQISDANYVFINKTDLISSEQLKAVQDDVASRTEGRVYTMSATTDPEGTNRVCKEMIEEILSWE